MNPPARATHTATPRPARPVSVEIPEPLRTPRLTIRPLTVADRSAFLRVIRDNADHLTPHLPLHEPGESDDDFFDRQARLATEGDARGTAWRRVAVLDDGDIAGGLNLNSISRGLAWDADAVWWIAESHTRRGLATEGLAAMLAHAMNPMPDGLGLQAVHCGIEPGNTASRRVAEKCGFRHAPDRQSYLKVSDRWVMHDFYVATPESIG